MRFRADPPGARVTVALDAFVAVFHPPSATTHLLVDPAPQILEALGDEALDLDTLLARLAAQYDLAAADRAALAERVDELVAAGLVRAA